MIEEREEEEKMESGRKRERNDKILGVLIQHQNKPLKVHSVCSLAGRMY